VSRVEESLSGDKYFGTFSIVILVNWEMRVMAEIQYVSDESGNPVGAIGPIELWREIES
jgi:hypothetical protein